MLGPGTRYTITNIVGVFMVGLKILRMRFSNELKILFGLRVY